MRSMSLLGYINRTDSFIHNDQVGNFIKKTLVEVFPDLDAADCSDFSDFHI